MALTAAGIRFSYDAAVTVLDGVSLEVRPGERVALVGPSGAGKTTFCRVLAGHLEPCAGHVEADGEPVSIRRTAGPLPVQLVWQHPEQAFDPRLALGASLREAGDLDAAQSRRVLDALGIRADWLVRRPCELSGGQLSRLSVARALIARPAYLIADEVSAMLDAVTQAELWGALLELQGERGFGIVLVSHSAALVGHVATRMGAL